jgi:cellulose synthase/poly-beta-1,6-N-acetylglucosamine synthase-like glycosyltransferase
LSEPLPDASLTTTERREPYTCALCLVRLHDQPLGLVEIRATQPGAVVVGADDVAAAIWQELAESINRHLRDDDLPPLGGLTRDGIASGPARCREEGDRILANAPLVSVIVPTRDRPEWLAECLRSLTQLEYPHYEIIVVDSAPTTDATAKLVRTFSTQLPHVHYAWEKHPGPSRARNRGLSLARGEIVAFTDDDAIVDRYWLAELVGGFGRGTRVACVTGGVLPRELETPAQIWFERFGGLHKGFTRRVFDLDEHRPPDALFPFAAGQFGSGPNMAFRTAALRAMGGFAPVLCPGNLAIGGEDLAVFFQTIQDGYQLVYEPGALVFHLHRREYAALRRQMFVYGSGLATFFLYAMHHNPAVIPQIARRLPMGLAYLLSPRSGKNVKKVAGYPADLTLQELRGVLYGPLAYLISLWRCARIERASPARSTGVPA